MHPLFAKLLWDQNKKKEKKDIDVESSTKKKDYVTKIPCFACIITWGGMGELSKTHLTCLVWGGCFL